MNEFQFWQVAQEHQREMLEEARRARLLKEAGYREALPASMKVFGLVLLVSPLAILLARAAMKS